MIVYVTGSLGARISELKQKVITENSRHCGLAVPREFNFLSIVFFLLPVTIKLQICSGSVVKMMWDSPEYLLAAVMPLI